MSIFDTQNLRWQTVLEIIKILMRKYIARKFMFFPAMKFVFTCTTNYFKYYSICTPTLHGFTLLSDFMSLPSTQQKLLPRAQIL